MNKKSLIDRKIKSIKLLEEKIQSIDEQDKKINYNNKKVWMKLWAKRRKLFEKIYDIYREIMEAEGSVWIRESHKLWWEYNDRYFLEVRSWSDPHVWITIEFSDRPKEWVFYLDEVYPEYCYSKVG